LKISPVIKRSDFYLIPNIMSVSRVFAIPLFGVFMLYQMNFWAALVFALAGLSDYVDGWVARRYGYESKLGMLLDPLADKIIIVSAMILLMHLGRLDFSYQDWNLSWVAPALVIITAGREIGITGLRSIASTVGVVMPADRWGKLKTWIQFFAILFLLLNWPPLFRTGQILLFISVITALGSGVSYTVRFLKSLPD
jgi:CDP-diacylglycerol--glycerol-3-phosphate 3-phosphatidyltransferase